jgi:hypothetical protein
MDPYVEWLRKEGRTLYSTGETYWRFYRKILVPASTKPEPTEIEPDQEKRLLRESGAYLLRCFSRTFATPTQFWYTLCDQYDFERLSGKMRTKIRRAQKDCEVRQVNPAWMAANAYPCYFAAHSRYKNGVVEDSPAAFEKKCRSCVDGPFAFLGAFCKRELAGFAKCIVGHDYVTMVLFKIDPKYSTSRPAYALLHELLNHHVAREGKPVNNGSRSLDHETNMQEFVLQFGFRPVYTDLKVVYAPTISFAIRALYPFRAWFSFMPAFGPVASIRTLLKQEEIRRSL